MTDIVIAILVVAVVLTVIVFAAAALVIAVAEVALCAYRAMRSWARAGSGKRGARRH